MPSPIQTGTRKTRPSLFLAAAGTLAAVASLAMTGDGLLHTQFETAFANRTAPILANNTVDKNRYANVPVAASEDYWLGDARNTPATLASWNDRAVGVGDSVTLTMRGIERQLKIISLKELPAGSIPNATGASERPVLVTLQPVNDGTARPIHMLLEGLADAETINAAAHQEL